MSVTIIYGSEKYIAGSFYHSRNKQASKREEKWAYQLSSNILAAWWCYDQMWRRQDHESCQTMKSRVGMYGGDKTESTGWACMQDNAKGHPKCFFARNITASLFSHFQARKLILELASLRAKCDWPRKPKLRPWPETTMHVWEGNSLDDHDWSLACPMKLSENQRWEAKNKNTVSRSALALMTSPYICLYILAATIF